MLVPSKNCPATQGMMTHITWECFVYGYFILKELPRYAGDDDVIYYPAIPIQFPI